MTMSRRDFATMLCLLPAALVQPARAAGQASGYPARPVKLIVPYAAGGGTDAIARLVAQAVGELLGQALVVENNGQSGGNLATQQAALAAPDGYTMLMANQGPMVVNPHLFKSVRIDPIRAFDPVTLIASVPLLVVVPKNSKLSSLSELVEFGRKNPGKLTYGSAGHGSASHLAAVLFLQQAKIDAVHVPYRGAGPAINDLLGGQLDFMITTVPSVLGQLQGDIVKALAITSRQRVDKFVAIPTITESGWPDYTAAAWYGFVVPKGTPAAIIAQLREVTVKAINTPALRERLASEGAEPIGSEPGEFRAMMERESAMWADVIGAAGIKVE
jgi:tripartite-type tricarboxylate transporter receptor subunit TctC